MQADISSFKEMVIEKFHAFKGFSSFTPSSSATISRVTHPKANAIVEGENYEKHVIVRQKPPSYMKGEKLLIVTKEKDHEVVDVEKEVEHAP
ncbi:hypothetical protein Tco_1045346 [Tanacetum coccineum]|uniref:Uncharacterized protein n=1 Tax=Tanacetum coccineum TaxID=301880 RepID=A0ABQ5GSH1_9ASTR